MAQSLIWGSGLYFARKRFNKDFWRIRKELDEQDQWDTQRVLAWQRQHLAPLLVRAFDRTVYYRTQMASLGLDRAAIENTDPFDVLEALPFLSRYDINAHRSGMIVRDYEGHTTRHKTSGSTGLALNFLLPTPLRWARTFAHGYRFYAWHNFHVRDPRVTIGGRYLGKRPGGVYYTNPFEQQLILGTHSLNEDSIGGYVAALHQHRPKAFQGHPSAISRLVDLAAQADLSLPEVETVFVTGETVWSQDRHKIEQAFGASLVSVYGHGEMCTMACECEAKDGFHYDPFYGIVELIPHASGNFEIVSTSLWNDAMPFLRYRTGDLVTGWKEGQCACGRPHPRLGEILGRVDDVIEDAEGNPVLPVQLRTDISQAFPWMPAYSLIQRLARPHYTLRIFAPAPLPAHQVAEVLEALQRWLGVSSQVEVEMAPPDALHAPNGKHRIVMKERAARSGAMGGLPSTTE